MPHIFATELIGKRGPRILLALAISLALSGAVNLIAGKPGAAQTDGPTCIRGQDLSRSPAKMLWNREDQYSSTSGEVWVEFELKNICPRPIKGFAYELKIIDAFGDTFFTGSGKLWAPKPIKRKFQGNRNREHGLFNLYGSEWKQFNDWWKQFRSKDQTATWEVVVTDVVFGEAPPPKEAPPGKKECKRDSKGYLRCA